MTKNAFAIVHFGSNPVYLELELYFFIMLRKYTKNDILYLYSVNDTPPSFVEAVRPLVDEVIPFSMTVAPSDALRPTFASKTTLVHVPRALTFVLRDPKASVPTVRLSPTTSKVP